MSTREETRQIRLASWQEVFRDRAASGMSVKNYCLANNISKNSYFYWQNIARKNALNTASSVSPRFAELSAPEDSYPRKNTPVAVNDTVIIDIGNASVRVSEGISRELLTLVVEVMSHAR